MRGSGVILLGPVRSLKFWLFNFPFLSLALGLPTLFTVSCLKRDVFILLHFVFLEEYHPVAMSLWTLLEIITVSAFSFSVHLVTESAWTM